MARGNARELAREKNQKKQQELKKKAKADEKDSNKGLSLEERRRRDAENMRLKQMKALEQIKPAPRELDSLSSSNKHD